MTSVTIAFERFIDKYFFLPICYISSLFKKNIVFDKKKIKKILLIKFWALGDAVVLLPTIQSIRKNFPKAQIDVLAHKRNKTIFEGQKEIDNIIDFGAINILKLFRKYDLCLDFEPALNVSSFIASFTSRFRVGFRHGTRSRIYHETILFDKKQHMVQNYLDFARKIGIKYNTDKLVPLSISNKDKKIIENYLKEQGITKNDFVVGISSGVAESVKYRMWPIEKMAKLADILVKKHNAKIIYIDAKSNKFLIEKIQKLMIENSISAAGLFNVKQSAELTRNCKIFISNDSGFMHIAAAEGVKTIGLFGPNTPNLWAPYGKGNISIAGHKKGCPYMDNTSPELITKKLTKDQLTVMDAISVEQVLHAVEKLK